MKRKGADYHHGDLRRALVEATLRLVAEHGTDGFTLRAAAKLAGVSDGAPYHHFEDKQALLIAVAEESFELLSEEMAAARHACPGNPRDKARATSVAYVSFAVKHPSRFRIMSSMVSQSRSKHRGLHEAARRTYNTIRESLMRVISDNGSKVPPKDVVLYAWATLHGLSALAVDGHFGASPRASEKVRELASGALQSFARGEPESAMPRSGSRSRPSRAPWSARRRVS